MTLIMICVYHCGLFSMTSNSRMMFAFSRDGALPHFFNKVDERFSSPIRTGESWSHSSIKTLLYSPSLFSPRCPEPHRLTRHLRTVWLAAFLSFCLALPSLGSSVAFAAATSIATIGLYVSYGIPILIGLIYPRYFIPRKGPFNLGIFSRPVALVAVLWIGFISIIFCLPTQNPVTSQTLNYTPVAVGIIAVGALGSWVLWARRWFTGPIRQIEAEQLGLDLDSPGAMEKIEEAEQEGVVGPEKTG